MYLSFVCLFVIVPYNLVIMYTYYVSFMRIVIVLNELSFSSCIRSVCIILFVRFNVSSILLINFISDLSGLTLITPSDGASAWLSELTAQGQVQTDAQANAFTNEPRAKDLRNLPAGLGEARTETGLHTCDNSETNPHPNLFPKVSESKTTTYLFPWLFVCNTGVYAFWQPPGK